MSIYDFGRELIKTRDLDPVYVVLHEADWTIPKLCNWLLAYFCFYHCGTASWIAEGPYWDRLHAAAASKDYPRASERRHFRGKAALLAVEELINSGQDPHNIIYRMTAGGNPPLDEIMERVKRLRGFGNWIAFKVADMLERLNLCSVQFTKFDIYNIYDSPAEGAALMWQYHGASQEYGGHDSVEMWAYHSLMGSSIGRLKAPPRYERTINAQEVETILCKFKSHLNGHYEVGKDIAEVKHHLERFKEVPMAQELLAAGRKGELWK